ncbi:type II toxin-antitoxin system RelE/ParE family toxin [Dissulfurispira sp.]|uniref:type II toxin-antitoxin system RelE/ParE family toxin n=1 Tax=Dissulfurispira sp. TaxID=2817609 RepID=UPI003FA53CAF
MNITFLAPAEAELLDAVAYYNTQSEGLGYEFAAKVKRTIERIIQYPEAWFQLSKRTRRCRTNRFPYGVIYQVRSGTLLIFLQSSLSSLIAF